MDVSYAEGDRVIQFRALKELYDIACLLRDNERFVVESLHSRATNEIAAVVSTSRLHNIASKYTGKDDPMALVRAQGNFPATGEILQPYRLRITSRARCAEAITPPRRLPRFACKASPVRRCCHTRSWSTVASSTR